MKRILISVVLAAICLSSFGQKQEEKTAGKRKGPFQEKENEDPAVYCGDFRPFIDGCCVIWRFKDRKGWKGRYSGRGYCDQP